MTEYVVIGDGAAGTTAAQFIRRRDPDGRITIYADDPNAAYYRAALTNYLIGELREDQLFAVPPDFYARHRIYRVLARVAAVDAANQRIALASGGPPVPYDRLCIASGSSPNSPSFPGAELRGVMTMRTMQDARTFMEDLRSGRVRRAVVVGGGPLALEWAQGLRARGIELTYVLRGRGFLSGLLDPTGSDLVGSRLRAFGCDLRLDEEVAEVLGDPQGRVQGVRLRTGGTIPAQLVCAAIGIRTNAAFLQGSGVEVNRGVPVDDRQRTNVDGVFAAGDVAEVFDPLAGAARGLGLWEPARLQGRVAGTNMAGGDAVFRVGVAYVATRLYDLDFAGIGRTIERDGDRVVADLPRGGGRIAYRKLVIEDGRLAGAILLGHRSERVRRYGLRLRRLIEERLDVSSVADRLLDPAFDLPGWMASQRGEVAPTRSIPMGGAVPTYSRLLRSPVAVSPLTRIELAPGALSSPILAAEAAGVTGAGVVSALEATTSDVSEGGQLATLTVEGGAPLELGPRTRIGRRPELEVVLVDPLVSGAHAEIRLVEGAHVVADTESRNGTFVNERRVAEPVALADGDTIRVGTTRLVFARTPGAEGAETLAPVTPVAAGAAVSGLFLRPEALEDLEPAGAELSGALEGVGRRFELAGTSASIGRDPQAEACIEDPAVSFVHAQVTAYGDGRYLRDLGSRNGTWVNGRLVTTPHRLRDGDVVHVGDTDLTFRAEAATGDDAPPAFGSAPPPGPGPAGSPRLRLRVESGASVGLTFELTGPEVAVGRDPGAEVALAEPTVSWRHLRLTAHGVAWTLMDLGSTNGTLVNGRPVEPEREIPIDPGAELRLGGVALRFEEAG